MTIGFVGVFQQAEHILVASISFEATLSAKSSSYIQIARIPPNRAVFIEWNCFIEAVSLEAWKDRDWPIFTDSAERAEL
jgi:hypothetical protein